VPFTNQPGNRSFGGGLTALGAEAGADEAATGAEGAGICAEAGGGGAGGAAAEDLGAPQGQD